MAEDFTIGPNTYRVTGKLNAFDQNHVVRKIGSVLVFLTSIKKAETDKPDPANPLTPRRFAKAIMATSGSLPDENVDYVIGACLSVTSRMQNGVPAPIRSPEGQLMFNDLSGLDLNEIVYHVLVAHELIDVFQDGPSV